ncbi:related to alpha/beta hydrolase [Cephalotrichum gorgonifer]|uniref:Related to alpha/beta hydrolase n=1 Tax=Cephalotrichum gorgonifer TaxID=2041049 RepID=A0AAE8N7B9_9PEZI|nr:related to alpha/beta hydrolase [Cephalotrichum gorgonifer]
MHQFFPGIFFNFETVRIAGMAATGGADLAECLDAVSLIKDNDPESWHRAWAQQAKKAEALAEEARAGGNRIAARNALLRASNYTRASYYMLPGDGPLRRDPRVLPLAEKSVALFRDATSLFDEDTVRPLRIPFEGHKLPGYLYLPPSWRRLPGRKTPVIVCNSGADGLSEEIYFFAPATALELGYAAVTYEGPGQGLTLHRDGLTFRPDWEAVGGAVLDHLEAVNATDPELDLDLDHVAIWGTSLGGYFALRAAAGDSRFKACVAIDPVHDFWDFATTQIPKPVLTGWERGWIGDSVIDAVVGLTMRFVFQMKWNINLSSIIFGISQPSQIMKAMKAYTLRLPEGKSRLSNIRCPVFVSGASNSLYLDVSDHTKAVYNGLADHKEGVDKEIWVAEVPGEGGLQAKVGAVALSNQRVFGFLDRHFNIKREYL